ncbi:MAG: hypothetical protein Q9165_003645 [Trypethelium subeluteriae]
MSPQNFSVSMGESNPSEVFGASRLTVASSTAGLGAHIMHGLGAASNAELSVSSSPARDPSKIESPNAIVPTKLGLNTDRNLSSAFACGLSYQAYSSFMWEWYRAQASETTSTTELLTFSVVKRTGAVYTTVDGIPRASVASGVSPNATIVPSITPVPTNSPPCGAFVLQPNGTCSDFNIPPETPGSCTLYGSEAQLFFFPPATQQSNSTATNMVVQAFAPGITFTSPSVYLSFDALWASSALDGIHEIDCPQYSDGITGGSTMELGGGALVFVGPTHRDVLLTLEPEDVSSVVVNLPESQTASIISALASGGSDYSYWAHKVWSVLMNGDYAYQRVTLANLIHPPNSAYYLQGPGPPGFSFVETLDGTTYYSQSPVFIQPEFAVPAGPTTSGSFVPPAPPAPSGRPAAPTPDPTPSVNSDPMGPSAIPGEGGASSSSQSIVGPRPVGSGPQPDPSSTEPSKSPEVGQGRDPKPASIAEPGSQPGPSASHTVSLNSVRPSEFRIAGPVPASKGLGLSGAVEPVASQDTNSDAGVSFDPMIASVVSGSADQEAGDRGPGGGGVVAGLDLGFTEGDNRYGTSDNEALGSKQEVTVEIGGHLITAASHTNAAIVDGHTLKIGDSDDMIEGHTFSAADKGILVDGSMALYSPIASSAPATARTADVNIDVTHYAAASHNRAVLIGSKTISVGGAPAMIGGHVVSAAAQGVVVDGTTAPFSQAASPAFDRAETAEFTIGGKPYATSWRPGAVIVGTNTLSPGGAAAVIHGQTVSAVSSGIVMDGSTEIYSAQGSSVTGASELAHRVILTVDSKPVTASEEDGALVVSGSTLRVGNSPVTINGEAISVGESGVVVGTSNWPFKALGLAPLTAGGLQSGQTTVQIGSSLYQISEAPNGQYAVLDRSMTLSAGAPVTMVDGQMVSAYPGGVKIGSSFINPGASVFTEDGHIFTVSPEAGDANIVVVNGFNSLTVGGAASIADGEKLSAVTGGVVGSFTVSPDAGSTTAVSPGISSSTVSPQVSSTSNGKSPSSGAGRAEAEREKILAETSAAEAKA